MVPQPILMMVVIIDFNYARNYNCQDLLEFGICDMRVTKKQAAENRELILREASRLIRERGISGTGVDALTEAAGMTHGSLYSQFGSKMRLIEDALAYAIKAKGQEVPDAFAVRDYVSDYLSLSHRDRPGSGCPFASLVCEIPRQSRGVQNLFTAGVRGMIGLLSGRMDTSLKPRQRDDKALATIASLVGALVLARAVNDPELSDNILRATKSSLDA
jgi:TetR/AcrR family transcriptional repressor of nem operon